MIVKFRKFYPLLPILFLVVMSIVVLYRDPFNASNLDIVPDSVEYALAAHHFAFAGEYKILVDGQWLPPRYPPWFSVLILAPTYIVLGPEIGNAIYPITIFGIAGIVLAFLIGKKIGGDWGGTLGALSVLALPTYRLWGRFVMTDVPATVLMLGLCLLYIRLRSKKSEQSIIYLVSGVIIAITIMFRPVFAATVFPFFICAVTSRHWTSKFRNVAILVSPLVIAGASTMIYNAIEFGSPLRNGYHYWTPVPYDYMHLTFSLSYVPQNLAVLWKTNLFFLMISAILICAIDRWIVRSNQYGCSRLAPIRWISEFILLGVGPIVLFHQIYFFPSERFYLPILTLTATMVGSMLGAWLSRLPSSVMICMLILSLFWAVLIQSSETKLVPDRRLAIEEILRYTPEDAWIISGIEPAYLEYMVSQASQRRVVPISRRVEYAGKVIARKKNPAPAPPPQNWYDHRCAGLLYGGAQEAVTFVAAEKLDAIEKQKFHGTRVFINLAYIKREDQPILDELKERFHVVPVTKTLFELCK